MKLLNLLILFFVILTLSSCVSTRGKRAPVIIPPGVDSTVAAVADSLVDSLFVSPSQQQKAKDLAALGKVKYDRSDSLWNLIEMRRDSLKRLSDTEKARADESKQKGAQKIQEALALRTNQGDSLSRELIRKEVFALLEESQNLFESALVDNPFDEDTKTWLANVYQMMANRFQNSEKYEEAVQILKSLIRMNQGEPKLYFRLGMNYWFLKKWQHAYENFQQAEKLLWAVTPMRVETTEADSVALLEKMRQVPVDTTQLFNYVYFQADTKAKLYEAEMALALLDRAYQIAPTVVEEQNITVYIGWIKWDDGNIKASELNDYYTKLENNGLFEDAATGFKKLLEVLKTERTRDEINWRISLLEFQHLGENEKGIDRLAQVIRQTAKDSIGAPQDSTYRRYFKDYGIMCYNMGIRHLSATPKVAFMYFKQAVTIDCPIRGKCFLELAKLSVNNPVEAVSMCHQALDYGTALSSKEKSQVFRLLVEGYKRQGKIDRAQEYFLKWKLLDAQSENTR